MDIMAFGEEVEMALMSWLTLRKGALQLKFPRKMLDPRDGDEQLVNRKGRESVRSREAQTEQLLSISSQLRDLQAVAITIVGRLENLSQQMTFIKAAAEGQLPHLINHRSDDLGNALTRELEARLEDVRGPLEAELNDLRIGQKELSYLVRGGRGTSPD